MSVSDSDTISQESSIPGFLASTIITTRSNPENVVAAIAIGLEVGPRMSVRVEHEIIDILRRAVGATRKYLHSHGTRTSLR